MKKGSAEWEKHRDLVIRTKQRSQEAYDGGILKVCGGSLGVSFAFVDRFIDGEPTAVALLLLAWACWSAALVGVVASHRYSTLAADRERGRIDRLDETIVGPDGRSLEEPNIGGWPNTLVRQLNAIGWVLFGTGILLLSAFIYINFEGGNSMAKDDKTPSGIPERDRPATERTQAGVPKREERGHDIIPPPGQAEKGGSVPGEGGGRRGGVSVPPPRRRS